MVANIRKRETARQRVLPGGTSQYHLLHILRWWMGDKEETGLTLS